MNIVDKLFDRLVITDSGCLEFVGARTGAGYGAVCTEDDVRLIRSMLDEGLSLRFIGDKFNVTPQAIHRIKSGLSWGWLQ